MAIMGGGIRAGGGGGGQTARGGNDDVQVVSEAEFEAEVIRSELPVLIEFSSERSAACKQVAPEVVAFAREMEGKVKVVKVDIDKSKLLARELRVQSVPTFMVFVEQRIADAAAGPISRKKMRTMVEPFLPRAAGAMLTLPRSA